MPQRVSYSAPTIVTDRLVLRAITRADFPALSAIWGDTEAVRFISGKPANEHESWMRLLRYGGLWPLLGFGYWGVEEKATGAYIGEMGLADFHRPYELPVSGVPEAGWILAPQAQGKGYAREALGACLAWADANLMDDRTIAIITPENTASIRLAEQCGYRRDGDVDANGTLLGLWVRNRRAVS
ncbi:GNAT family N-acetyltransferase [Oryzibacter oryziterrae]|uniref:GNAT family N-acetyltransferase n=1 Tax=Oryzibacter oryziterrae TaxID=2766474 RepID=UPI001F242207|nr:GNAT family N-acetyltransferase [Oryzibacter oryziterrae]